MKNPNHPNACEGCQEVFDCVCEGDLFGSFKRAFSSAGLRGEPNRYEFELYLNTGVPMADWEDKDGSLDWLSDWEGFVGLVR